MKLTRDNAEAVVGALETLIDQAETLRDAGQEWLDLADERDAESREAKAEYREEWDGTVDDVEASAIELLEVFGYVAVPRKLAQKAGLIAKGERHPTYEST